MRAQCFSYGDANYRVGEVVVVRGGRSFYVNRKGRRVDAINLFWYHDRDIGAY